MSAPQRGPLWRRIAAVSFVVALALSLVACSSTGSGEPITEPAEEPPVEQSPVFLASTTSTEDSGLFNVLIPAFEAANPAYSVKVIAVGTGEALEQGRNKDADVLLVHAKADEEQFVAEGYGTQRRDVMYNDFVLLGPADDPAGLKGLTDTDAVMKAIADSGAVWVSRGDDSGTHKKELKLWDTAGIEPAGAWYLETGQGMGETLKVATEKTAYTLADRATYLSMQDTLDLEILFEKADELLNQYGVIPVTDATNAEGAQAFADWVTGDEGQAVIADFGVEEFGQPLFVPNAQ
jgi:tungstate transport system substrate-binding protein